MRQRTDAEGTSVLDDGAWSLTPEPLKLIEAKGTSALDDDALAPTPGPGELTKTTGTPVSDGDALAPTSEPLELTDATGTSALDDVASAPTSEPLKLTDATGTATVDDDDSSRHSGTRERRNVTEAPFSDDDAGALSAESLKLTNATGSPVSEDGALPSTSEPSEGSGSTGTSAPDDVVFSPTPEPSERLESTGNPASEDDVPSRPSAPLGMSDATEAPLPDDDAWSSPSVVAAGKVGGPDQPRNTQDWTSGGRGRQTGLGPLVLSNTGTVWEPAPKAVVLKMGRPAILALIPLLLIILLALLAAGRSRSSDGVADRSRERHHRRHGKQQRIRRHAGTNARSTQSSKRRTKAKGRSESKRRQQRQQQPERPRPGNTPTPTTATALAAPQSHPKRLRLFLWNVQTFNAPRRAEFAKGLAAAKKQGTAPDFAALTEVKMTPTELAELHFEGYQVYGRVAPQGPVKGKKTGGILLLVRSGLTVSICPNPPGSSFQAGQSDLLVVKVHNCTPALRIGVFYRRDVESQETKLANKAKTLDFLADLSQFFVDAGPEAAIAMGDLNIFGVCTPWQVDDDTFRRPNPVENRHSYLAGPAEELLKQPNHNQSTRTAHIV